MIDTSDFKPLNKAVAWFYTSASQDTGYNKVFSDCLKFTNADMTVANTLWGIFEVAGIFLLLLWFLFEINKVTMQMVSDSRVQQLVAPFLKLVLGLLLLQYGKDIVSSILGLGNGFVDIMLGKGTEAGSVSGIEELVNEIKDKSLLECLGMILPAAAFWVISLFAQLMIIYQSITRKINVVLYTGLTPLALGDIYQFEQSNAIRFLKKLLANVLWGGLMIAVLKVGATISASVVMSDNKDMMLAVFYPILVPLAEAGIISSCKQICYDALGC